MLVYDLGGGTFDDSLVQVDEGIVEVKASRGDTQLGGDDFDNLLVAFAAGRFAAQEGLEPLPATALRRLKGVMEQAKIQLSEVPYAAVQEEYLDGSRHLRTEVARTEYEELILPFLEKTLECTQRALHDAGVTARDLDKIMLVGGATRTPLVHELIARRIGMTPRHEIDPDLIVAMGAAIQGAALGGQPAPAILIDITAHTYRVEVLSYGAMICAPLIPRGTPLPVRRAESYTTPVDNQERVEIKVFQGEGLFAHENTLLGQFMVTGLSKKPAGNPVVVQFQLDLNGLLTATATEKLTGLAKTISIDTRGQHRLNLDAARANLDALFARQFDEGEFDAGVPEGWRDVRDLDESDFTDDEDEDEDEEDNGDEDEDEDEELAEAAMAGANAASSAAGVEEFAADDSAPPPPGLIASAKSLRQRAEALLAAGVSEKDAADIRELLGGATSALKARQWSALRRHADSLSDIIFYLED
jgi:molecular chaperone DnaK